MRKLNLNKRFFSLFVILVIINLVLFAACRKDSARKIPPKAIDGVLDLNNWDLKEDGPVDLTGEWEFYWKKLLKPEDFSQSEPPEKTGILSLPGVWNGYLVNGKKLSGDGYATYRLKILIDDHKGPLAIKLLDMGTAFTVYVSGRKTSFAGVAGKTSEATAPGFFSGASNFISETNKIEIILQVSNFHHRLGGPWEVIRFGREGEIRDIREKSVVFDIFLFGGILIMGLYHLCLFSLRKKDRSPLYFGIFCFLTALRILVTGERYLIHLFPGIDWELLVKFEYLSFYLAVPVFAMFIHSLFYQEFPQLVLRIIQFLGIIFSCLVLLTPAKIYSHSVQPYQIITLMSCIYAIYVLILSSARKREGALIVLLGFIVLFLAVINDILYTSMITQIGYLAPFGLLFFLFFQAYLLSRRFSKAFFTIEKQSRELKDTNAACKHEIAERKRAEQSLIRYRDQLKLLVSERTAKLTEANKQLQQEIAERKRSEEALHESTELFDSFMRYLPALAFMKDSNGRYIYFNEGCKTFYHVDPADRIGKTDDELWPEDIAEQIKRNDRKVISEGRVLDTVETVTDGDEIRYHLVTKFTILKNGTPPIVAGIAFDITDKMKTEEDKERLEVQLQRAQKMEALGLLAGGVAHDLNNVLSGIVSYPELLLMDLPEDSSLRKPILTIQQSGKKAAEIVQDLLTLARRGVTNLEILNINDIISDYLKSAEYEKLKTHYPSIYLETNIASDLLNIKGSSIHLKKTVMNLVSNSAESQPKGGRITISTANQYVDRPIKGYDNVQEGEFTVLKVEDKGTGIAPDDLKHIFEPFFTKKVMGRSGTGLGMAVVWGTVQDHKGYINIESAEGKGSTFELYFPVTREDIVKEKNLVPIEEYKGKGESILVVDDVKEQREIASVMLTKLGYVVTTVSSGKEAVEYLKNHSADLLVLDMIMDPGMDGLETYKKIIELHPKQKAIIASGFSETDRVKEAQNLGAGEYVKKPYDIEKIGLAVRAELDK